jgi:hypothetical protein
MRAGSHEDLSNGWIYRTEHSGENTSPVYADVTPTPCAGLDCVALFGNLQSTCIVDRPMRDAWYP